MKNKIAFVLGLFLALGLVVGCTGNDAQNGSMDASSADDGFVLDKPLPDVPEEIMSYKIIQPDVTIESVSNLGAKFGLTGKAGPVEPSAICMSNKETRVMLQVFIDSGAIEYDCVDELFPSSPSLPDNDEAVNIATEFLKSHGFWHDDLVAENPVVGGAFNDEPSHLLVRFTRYINDMPLTGPGNKLAVRIGDKGKVVSLFVYYPEIEPDRNIKIITPDTAFDKLKASEGGYVLPFDCSKVLISEVSIGYYLEPITDEQERLDPYYVFKGECRDSNDVFIEEFTGWVDAAAR